MITIQKIQETIKRVFPKLKGNCWFTEIDAQLISRDPSVKHRIGVHNDDDTIWMSISQDISERELLLKINHLINISRGTHWS